MLILIKDNPYLIKFTIITPIVLPRYFKPFLTSVFKQSFWGTMFL